MADLTTKQVLQKLGKDILNWVKTNCVDNLVSTSKNLPLSANQGRVLKEGQDAINQSLDGIVRFEMTTSFNSNSGEFHDTNFSNSSTMWFFTCQNGNYTSPLYPIRQGMIYRNALDDTNWIRITLDSDNTRVYIESNSTWINKVSLYAN